MTLDPKKLPPWMRKPKPEDQGKQQTPPPGDESQVDLPPWLRDDLPLPEPKVRRVAPLKPENSGGDPPWLADVPAVEEPKSYKIGGTEISAEYLAGGDELPETLDSEMTFDAWMADQLESKRVKDIEEEVPDLFSDIGDDQPAEPDAKSTGQLPDWFLGLEALDTSEAPEWFVNEDIPDAQSKLSTDVPPWISDLVIEDEETPEAEAPPPEDEFGSLLKSIGRTAPDDEAAPEDEWSLEADDDEGGAITDDFFAQLTAVAPERAPAPPRAPAPADEEDEVPSFEDLFAGLGGVDEASEPTWQPPDEDVPADKDTPADDFFAQLGENRAPKQETLSDTEAVVEDFFAELGDAPPQPSQQAWQLSTSAAPQPDFDEFDDFPDDDVEAPGAVEIPQNELDAFFDNVASVRSTPSLDHIAEPDLDWFVESQPEIDEPEEAEPPPPPLPPVDREDTMSWLNELSSIVTSVTRPLQPEPPEEPVVYDTGRLSDLEIERAVSEARSDVEEFAWPAAPVAPEPEPEPEPDPSDWLEAITPDDLAHLDLPPAETPPPPRRSLLSERLRQAEKPPKKPDPDDEDRIFRLPSGDPAQDALIPEDELRSGWLRDDLFSAEETPDGTPFQEAEPEPENSFDEAVDDDEEEIDFFSLLESNADANVLLRTGQLRQLDEAPASPPKPPDAEVMPETDLSESRQQAEPGDTEMSDDDFYRSFGLTDDHDDADAKPGGVSDDHFYASFNTGGMDDNPRDSDDDDMDAKPGGWDAQADDTGDDDDFFASLGFDAEDALGGQDDQQDEAALDDDFFASLGLGSDDADAPPAEQTPLPDWMNQQAETEPQDDDLFASLNFDAADVEAAQPTYTSDEELLAALGISSDDVDMPSVAEELPEWSKPQAETEDESFNAVLGMIDAAEVQPTYASDEELLAALGLDREDADAQPASAGSPEWAGQPDEDFDALFGGIDVEEMQPAEAAPMPESAIPADESEAEADDGGFDAVLGMIDAEAAQPTYASDEELMAALGIGGEDEDEAPAAAEMPEWTTQPGEPEIDAEEAQPTYASDEELLAALGISSDDVDMPFAAEELPEWTTQPGAPETEAREDEAFDAVLGMIDSEEAQPTYASDEELMAALGIGEDEAAEAAQPAEAELPEWAKLHYEPEAEDEDYYAAPVITEPVDERSAAAEMPAWANPQSEAEDEDFDALFGAVGAEEAPAEFGGEDLFGQWVNQADDELPPDEDIFAEPGMGDAEAAQPAAPEEVEFEWRAAYDETASQEEDFFASASAGAGDTTSPPDDLFAQWATEAEMPPTEDFYSALDMIGEGQADEEPDPLAWAETEVEAPPEEDFFSALGMIGEKPPVEPSAPGFTDIDSYLASLPTRQPEAEPETGAGFEPPVDLDLDAILSGSVFEDEPLAAQPSPTDLAPGMTEDWLAQLQANVEEVSASAIVRQKEDRPVEELPSRLQRLRRLSEQVPEEAPPDDALTEVLPGVPTALAPAPFVSATPGLAQGVALTPEQQAKADLLKTLVPVDVTPKPFRISAIEATYDSPFMAGLEDTPETILQPIKEDKPRRQRARRPRGQRQRIRIDRFLIALLLAAAVILPFFVGGFRIGSLPPNRFAASSPAQVVFDRMDAIPPGALVLVGVEYSPASAAELDGMTDALVRHILLRAAYPVVVSGNPLGLLRTENLIASINEDADFLARIGAAEPLQANDDYFIVRYLPGSVIGLRAFSQDTGSLLLSDIRGQASKLVVRSLREFALVVVITDRAEDMRAYAEQIAPLTDAPLVSAVSYGAAPLAEPYAKTLGGGLLVGLGDAYTYASTLGLASARDLAERIRIIPTNTPSPTWTPTAPPQMSATAVLTPSATALPPTATWTPEPLIATIISRQAVNMRSGPGTDNSVLAGIPSGTTVLVLGFNEDGSWVNVQIADGRQGWISASLLEIREGELPASKRNYIPPRRQQINEDEDPTATPRAPTATPSEDATSGAAVELTSSPTASPVPASPTAASPSATRVPPTATRRPTRTPSLTPTVEATAEVTAEATAEATPEAAALSGSETGYRDERWYAMNTGIIASALIITFGAVVNLARGLLRRGRRR